MLITHSARVKSSQVIDLRIGVVQGTLRGYDSKANAILSDSVERLYSADAGVEEQPLGLYLVKGDVMSVTHTSLLNSELTSLTDLVH